MTTFDLIEAKPWHCGQMARALRVEHHRAVLGLGCHAHRELSGVFELSFFRRAFLVDGRLVALGGVIGSLLSTTGFVWLAVSEGAARHKVAIVREARRQLAQLAQVKRTLVTSLLPGDETAKRFAAYLGFVEAEGVPLGFGGSTPMIWSAS